MNVNTLYKENESINVIDSFSGENEFLSNFAEVPCGVIYENVTYRTVEHAYNAAKTLNLEERELVRIQPTPGKAKKIGQKVTLRVNWDTYKFQVMYDLLLQKFSDRHFADLLLDTQDAILIEGNFWNDIIWGVCNGIGENMLGKMLMKLRNMLREGK